MLKNDLTWAKRFSMSLLPVSWRWLLAPGCRGTWWRFGKGQRPTSCQPRPRISRTPEVDRRTRYMYQEWRLSYDYAKGTIDTEGKEDRLERRAEDSWRAAAMMSEKYMKKSKRDDGRRGRGNRWQRKGERKHKKRVNKLGGTTDIIQSCIALAMMANVLGIQKLGFHLIGMSFSWGFIWFGFHPVAISFCWDFIRTLSSWDFIKSAFHSVEI